MKYSYQHTITSGQESQNSYPDQDPLLFQYSHATEGKEGFLARKEDELESLQSRCRCLALTNFIAIFCLLVFAVMSRTPKSLVYMCFTVFFTSIIATSHSFRHLQLSFRDQVIDGNFSVARLSLWFLALVMMVFIGVSLNHCYGYWKCLKEDDDCRFWSRA